MPYPQDVDARYVHHQPSSPDFREDRVAISRVEINCLNLTGIMLTGGFPNIRGLFWGAPDMEALGPKYHT